MEASILIFKFFLIIFIFFFFFNGNQNQKTILGKARIIDGDTIHIGNNKIRLYGIDAPEINQNCSYNNEDWKCGQLSKNFLLNQLRNNGYAYNHFYKSNYPVTYASIQSLLYGDFPITDETDIYTNRLNFYPYNMNDITYPI